MVIKKINEKETEIYPFLTDGRKISPYDNPIIVKDGKVTISHLRPSFTWHPFQWKMLNDGMQEAFKLADEQREK